MSAAFIALLVLVGIERLVEVGISSRNQRKMKEQGARKIPEPHYPWLVLFHAAVLVSAGLEVLLLRRPLIPALAVSMLIIFIVSNVLRWWVIRLLGGFWNVQIMDSSHIGFVTTGPYRWIRHPNYLGVILELFSLPMIHTAWITAIIGTLGYGEILRRRIRMEEGALMANPAYRSAMGGKPRLLPKIF